MDAAGDARRYLRLVSYSEMLGIEAPATTTDTGRTEDVCIIIGSGLLLSDVDQIDGSAGEAGYWNRLRQPM